jgi:hypothetical protein
MMLIPRRFASPSRARRRFLCLALAVCAGSLFTSAPRQALAQATVSIPEEIEWTWEVRPPHPDTKLPNVLLLGDSITRNYFPEVTKNLSGIANVYLMSSSTSVGDPRLSREIEEFSKMEKISFRVVHFNNGMHGWDYTEAQFKAAFPEFLSTIQALPEHPKLIWANITPVKLAAFNGATNPRIDTRNIIAGAFIEAAEIPLDDQHALMIKHSDLYEDTVHFNKAGSAIMGDQASSIIKQALLSPAQ